MAETQASRGRVIVTGILFWYPLAGVTYQFLHYLLGLRRLGYDVYYIEDSGRMVYDPTINSLSVDATNNVNAVAPILEAHGFRDHWAFRSVFEGGQCFGLSKERILQLYREADALLNVTCAQEIREEHLACRRRLYVESDPFSWQVRYAQGDAAAVAHLEAHDTHFSFGENIGAPDCLVPTGPFKWLPTRQPVLLDEWHEVPPVPQAPFTTITTWHNKARVVTYQGRNYYWTKDREFEHYLDLPERRPGTGFELATTLSPDTEDRLRRMGWRIRNSVGISNDPDRYREYIRRSRGEFTVARDQYVRPRTGWFSDRSACYLAAGRPVITQETGFSTYIPSGRGLFGYNGMEEVLAAVDAIAADYDAHCRAAREIAGEYFAAEKVLRSMMERAGLY